jgi:hypothetical protein
MNEAVIFACIGIVVFLVSIGIYFMTKTSTTTTPVSPGPGPGPAPGPAPGPGKSPPPSSLDLCKESDSTKCCNSSKKCQQSEVACQCPIGQSYDCKTNSCVANCVCPNGTPATGKACGKVHGATVCSSCNKGFGGSSKGCVKYTCAKGAPWQTACPTGWSCCHVEASSHYKCCKSGCSHGSDTCKDDAQGEFSPQDAPGWSL